MTSSLVSIIMPCFNSSHYIADAINSVLAQSYTNWELIIVDNGSVDGTLEIIKKYSDWDERILVCHSEDMGASYARNKGIEVSKGDFIAFIDSDDVWDFNKLKTSLECMLLNEVYLFCSAYTPMSYDGLKYYNKRVPLPEIKRSRLLKTCDIGCSTVVIRVDCFAERNLIPRFPNMKKEDYAYWFKLLEIYGRSFYGLQDSLTYYRIHSGGVSSNKLKELFFQYKVYKDYLSLGVVKSVYYLFFYMSYGIRKTYFND
ncbi:glycosyltransferase [Shewanella xiamenensis]|uniref:glycosyltransferase family 2 protein n=1 Tax=Shewanella xiamenensis TaxID=332186 RepID=UPI000D649A9D|nr:glycosyltransferase family 2 protein [Shewanella xiamenensis]MCT8858008.1 glycosyltransferase [Shewanella xiamenensis]PWH04407.1 glycosyl transferase [Shewanella xiamenensis]UWG63470.1 glycosyltransferase [Shewanella xiamenensis]